jgi:hypothetical protein
MSKKNAEKRFRQISKEIRRQHTEYLKLVDDAQNILPLAVRGTRDMYKMMARMNDALEVSRNIMRLAYKAFRQLNACPDKKKRGLVQKQLSMNIIQTHHLTSDPYVVQVFIDIRNWMKKNKIPLKTPRKKAPAKKK